MSNTLAVSRQISERYWVGSSTLHGELTVERSDGHRFRAKIERNAYDFQSFARVFFWTKDGWTTVCSRPIEGCAMQKHSYGEQGTSWHATARADLEAMLAEAFAVVPERGPARSAPKPLPEKAPEAEETHEGEEYWSERELRAMRP